MTTIIWKRKNNTYYYRKYNFIYNTKYYIGFTNQYEHEVVLIIEPELKEDNFMRKRLKYFLRWLYKKL